MLIIPSLEFEFSKRYIINFPADPLKLMGFLERKRGVGFGWEFSSKR